MTLFDWIVSLAALAWLTAIAVFDIRTRKVPSPLWTAIPMLLAAAVRLLSGSEQSIVAAAAVVVAVSERRHLKQRVQEILVAAAGILILGWIIFSVGIFKTTGIIGVVVFWAAWELHWIGGADAMVLITCLMVWPGMEFVYAYLLAGLGWSIGVRIREGGWWKGHAVPGLAIVFTGAILYLLYRALTIFVG
jgi:hypothetical protein